MSEDKNRFVDNGEGLKWLKLIIEPPHEKPDTQGTIIPQSEEN